MALAIDQSVTVAASTGTSITTAQFSTSTTNELLIAFVSADGFFNGNATRLKVSDSTGMVWMPLGGEGVQAACVQVYYALATATKTNMTVTATMEAGGASGDRISMNVVTFTGHNTSTPIGAVAGTNSASGLPSITLTTVGANSWVWAAENMPTNRTSTTAGTSQTKQYQDASAGSHGAMTVWKQTSTTTSAGTSVTMNLTGVTDAYNGIAFEIIDSAANVGTSLILDNITKGDFSLGAGGTATLAHTCNGSNRVLFVLVTVDDSNQNPHQTSSVTYNGVGLTNLRIDDSGSGNEYRTEIWYKVAPASGSNNVVVTLANVNYVGVFAISFQNASQNAPTLSNGTTSIVSGAGSLSITTTDTNPWAIGVIESQQSVSPTTTNNGYMAATGWNQSYQMGTVGIWPLLGAAGSKTFTVSNGSSGIAYSVAIVSPIAVAAPSIPNQAVQVKQAVNRAATY